MQNIILGVGAVVILIAGYLYFTSGTSTDMGDEPMVETPTPMGDETMMDADQTSATVVDVAVATPSVSTLVAALTAADLVETLKGAGPFTVFAPVNEAFAALPAGTVESLLLPENIADLQAILTYHVVPGAVMAGALTDGMEVTTVNGQTLTINVATDGAVTINGSAKVISADVPASNGVIHLIDAVLLPPAV